MKQAITIIALCVHSFSVFAQQPFWVEDFGFGCNRETLANGHSTNNGTWTVSYLSTPNNYSNEWFVSATEAGMGLNNCRDGCLNSSSFNNMTLHVGIGINAIGGGQGNTDNTAKAFITGSGGGFFNALVQTDKRVESPTIDCSGRYGIQLSFLYLGISHISKYYTEIWYYDGSNWSFLSNTPGSLTGCSQVQYSWRQFTPDIGAGVDVNLPSSANNNPYVKIGFRWYNEEGEVTVSGTEFSITNPSFAVDDIKLFDSPNSVQSVGFIGSFETYPNPFSGSTTIAFSSETPVTVDFKVFDVTGKLVESQTLNATQGANSVEYGESLSSGVYTVQIGTREGVKIIKVIKQ